VPSPPIGFSARNSCYKRRLCIAGFSQRADAAADTLHDSQDSTYASCMGWLQRLSAEEYIRKWICMNASLPLLLSRYRGRQHARQCFPARIERNADFTAQAAFRILFPRRHARRTENAHDAAAALIMRPVSSASQPRAAAALFSDSASRLLRTTAISAFIVAAASYFEISMLCAVSRTAETVADKPIRCRQAQVIRWMPMRGRLYADNIPLHV